MFSQCACMLLCLFMLLEVAGALGRRLGTPGGRPHFACPNFFVQLFVLDIPIRSAHDNRSVCGCACVCVCVCMCVCVCVTPVSSTRPCATLTTDGLHIEPNNAKKLQKIITENHIAVKDTKIFYNSTGPNSTGSDEIYIDCQPVNEDGSILVSENNGKGLNDEQQEGPNINISGILSSPVGMIIIGLIIGYIIIKIINYLISKSGGTNNA